MPINLGNVALVAGRHWSEGCPTTFSLARARLARKSSTRKTFLRSPGRRARACDGLRHPLQGSLTTSHTQPRAAQS